MASICGIKRTLRWLYFSEGDTFYMQELLRNDDELIKYEDSSLAINAINELIKENPAFVYVFGKDNGKYIEIIIARKDVADIPDGYKGPYDNFTDAYLSIMSGEERIFLPICDWALPFGVIIDDDALSFIDGKNAGIRFYKEHPGYNQFPDRKKAIGFIKKSLQDHPLFSFFYARYVDVDVLEVLATKDQLASSTGYSGPYESFHEAYFLNLNTNWQLNTSKNIPTDVGPLEK